MTSKITVFLQAFFWAVLGFFGVTALPPDMTQIMTPAITGLAGFLGPSVIEWNTRFRNQLSAAFTIGLALVAELVAHQHMSQRLAGLITGLLVAGAHLFAPSSAHPSRLP